MLGDTGDMEMTSTVAVGLGVELGNCAVVTVGILAISPVDRVGCLTSVPWGVAAGLRQASVTISIARVASAAGFDMRESLYLS